MLCRGCRRFPNEEKQGKHHCRSWIDGRYISSSCSCSCNQVSPAYVPPPMVLEFVDQPTPEGPAWQKHESKLDRHTALTRRLLQHQQKVTRELVNCSCGWYTKRGEGAPEAIAGHIAAVVLMEDE